MRWDNLLIEGADEQASLTGYRDPAVIRRFDAPEALDVRFYEVRARSALNRVPERSAMPFRWTVNPYRGCTHACVYCAAGDTSILMADGRTRPLAELAPGDEIVGTEMRGRCRRYVTTRVLAHWSTIKPAYRTVLEDGTELVTSGDHRLLTRRGWKHVQPATRLGEQRPYLTTNDELLGTGRFGGRPWTHHFIRWDPGDDEALQRAEHYLAASGSETGSFAVQAAAGAQRVIARTRVVSVEPLGVALRMYDITTGTGDFVSNGVVSHNCFARPTHKYLDMSPGRDFEREIVVKVNAPELLRAELARPSWAHEHVAMGTNTDPYQWVEGRYRLMPGIWEALRDSHTPCSVLTKSPLLLRDLPLMRDIAERGIEISANLSVPTLDEKAWRATEPHTPHPRARLEAVAELNRAGIPAGILVAPLMPGINDAPEQVEPILRMAEEAEATSIGGIALHLRGEVRGIFFDWLRSHRPDLLARYEQLYARGAYAPKEERERIASLVRGPRWTPPRGMRRGAAGQPDAQTVPSSTESGEPSQQALF